MDAELKRIHDDFLGFVDHLLAQASDEENRAKFHIADILTVVAGAIEEDELGRLSEEVRRWGDKNLLGQEGLPV